MCYMDDNGDCGFFSGMAGEGPGRESWERGGKREERAKMNELEVRLKRRRERRMKDSWVR